MFVPPPERPATPAARYAANLAALTVLRDLGDAVADDVQRCTLAGYVGWVESALLKRIAHPYKTNAIDGEVARLLTTEQGRSVLESTPTAHYTPAGLVRGVWAAVVPLLARCERLRVLEPAAGTGAFIGWAPAEVRRRATFTAVELDAVAAAILGKIYPEVCLHVGGYEAADLLRDHYDLVIGNVPFGDFGVADVSVSAWMRKPIHDYFIMRAVEHVRPGGVVALLTSRWTLDKQGEKAREYIARRAKLLGVVRLPSGVFPDVGPEVIVDLVVLQRRPEMKVAASRWTGLCKIEWTEPDRGWDGREYLQQRGATINAYVANRADVVVCGTPLEVTAQYRRTYSVAPHPDAPPLEVDILARMAKQIRPGTEVPPLVDAERIAVSVQPQREHPDNDAGRLWFAAYAAAKALLQGQSDGADDETFGQLQTEALGAFVAADAGAPLADRAVRRALDGWDLLPFVLALGYGGKPADLLTRRTVRGDVATALTLSDALALSLNRVGCIDTGVIAEALGTNRIAVAKALIDGGHAFRDPDRETLVPSEEYLSGDVRAKLALARLAARAQPEYAGNIDALEAVQPEDVPATSIGVAFGARWIPGDVYEDFARSLIPSSRIHVKVAYVAADAFFAVDMYARGPEAERWGTPRMSVDSIFECCLNFRSVKVYDEDAHGKKTPNPDASLAAQAKAADIKEAFAAWLWQDDARRERLVRSYNDRFNCLRRRQYDGSRLTFPGMSSAIELRRHQRNAIARALQSPRGMDEPAFIHPGGAGKTFEVIATAIKGIQIGAWRRVLIAVPNHLIDQWYGDVVALYPGWADEVTVADTKDRVGFMARAAMGRWSIIICTHSQLKMIPVHPRTEEAFLMEEETRLVDYLDQIDGEYQSVKRVQKKLRALRAKIENKQDEIRRDSDKLTTFEDLHIDCMIVDESQAFKNLGFMTRLEVAGLSNSESQRAFDCYMKMTSVQRRGGRTIFATATPVANTLAELHIVMRYLQGPRLKAMGLELFDAFAGAFTEVYQSVEMKPAGDGYRIVNRIRFHNLPELAEIVAQSWDLCSVEDLHLDLPQLVGGREDVVSIPASENLTAYIADLAQRAVDVKDGKVKPDVDNMLRITSDGRKAAMLNGDPATPVDALTRRTKIDDCAAKVLEHWHESVGDLGAQLVFCDLYTPRAGGRHDIDEGGTAPETPEECAWASAGVYGLLRHRLEEGGIPSAQIAFIHDANTQTEKTALRAAVNSGAVRVLIGSTEKMSTGLNVQGRLIAVHHLDTPWRPDGIVQRNWRMIRQGNLYRHVYIHIYVTEGSFDGYMWGLQRAKLEMITQIMQASPSARTADDVGDAVLSAAQVQAIASGDGRILARVGLEGEIIRLDRSLRSWLEERWNAAKLLRRLPGEIIDATEQIAAHREAATHLAGTVGAAFRMDLLPKSGASTLTTYADKGEAHQVLKRLLKPLRVGDTVLAGRYRGCDVELNGRGEVVLIPPGAFVRYTARVTETPVGTVASMDHALTSGVVAIVHLEGHIRRYREDLAAAGRSSSVAWPHAAKYREAFARYRAITEELSAAGTKLPLAVDEREVPEPLPSEVSKLPEFAPTETTNSQAPTTIAKGPRRRKVPDTQLAFGW